MILYLTFATLWTFIVEFVFNQGGEQFGWKERIINFIITPLAFAIFIHTLIEESFK
jgi:hypothetical protein